MMEHRNAYLREEEGHGVSLRLHYVECKPAHYTEDTEVILLIHGFPQTSYQYRNVMQPLADAGYRVIAPDYRGAGESSRPAMSYDKVSMAKDLYCLLRHYLRIERKVHVVGHDIGAMIAYAFVTDYPDYTKSITWGECPLPGSTFYDRCKNGVDKFHFTFHCVPDGLPEALVYGRERIYLKQFFTRQCIRTDGISQEDFDHYVDQYSMPDAMRASFEVYRAFEEDKRRNTAHRDAKGRSKIPNLVLSGELSDHRVEARAMAEEFFDDVQEAVVSGSAHYVAEENPQSFVDVLCTFYRALG